MTEPKQTGLRAPNPQLLAARTALSLARPVRSQIEAFQGRIAHLGAIAMAGRVKSEELETQARLLGAEINNARHVLRTELQNMPSAVRQAGPVRDVLRGLDSAHRRARRILDPNAPRSEF